MKKKLLALAVIALSFGVLTGCKKSNEPSKEDLQTSISILNSTISEQSKELDSLKRLLATYNPNLAEVQDLKDYTTLATGDEAYVALRDRINILNPIKIEPSNNVQNETVLNLTNNIRFVPNQNWSIQTSSGKIKMNHSNGVYGEVEAYEYIGSVNQYNSYSEFIEPHLKAIKADKIGDIRLIFLSGGNQAGSQVTSRIKVATLNDNTKHIMTEEMTQPYEEAPLNIDDATEVEESTEETSVAEESTEETEGVDSKETGTEESSIAETELQPGDLTGETVYQDENNIYSIDNYLYTCGTAIYNTDGSKSYVLVFKFFYKEGDAVDVATKTEFVDNTIKSFAIDGNYLTLQ